MKFDINIEEMTIEELRHFARHLMRLHEIEAECINDLKKLVDLLEKPQGE
jgi:hypothetical protein